MIEKKIKMLKFSEIYFWTRRGKKTPTKEKFNSRKKELSREFGAISSIATQNRFSCIHVS